MTPSSGEEETSQRAQEEMRAAAHAADSILEGLETEDTKFITFNALSSIFNILNGLHTALGSLSERWWHLGGQAKQSSAQQELVSGKLNTRPLLPSLDREGREGAGAESSVKWEGKKHGLKNTRSKDAGVAREMGVLFSLSRGRVRNRKEGFAVFETPLKRWFKSASDDSSCEFSP